MRDSFIMYRSYVEALMELPDDQRLRILDAIMRFGLDGTEPDFQGVDKAIFTLIRPQLQANNARYENGKKGAEYGSLGGRPRKNGEEKPQENPTETPKKPQENPTETPNENVNVNENVNENENVCETRAPAREDTPLERFLERWQVNSNAIGNYSGGKLAGIDWDKVSEQVEKSAFLQQQKGIAFFIAHYEEIVDGTYADIHPPRRGRVLTEDALEAKRREYDALMGRRTHGST